MLWLFYYTLFICMAQTVCIARVQPNQVFEAPGSTAGHVAQGLVQRFTSAFEETKRELEGVTNDMEHSFSLQLATKLNSEELPQKLQEASLVSRASLQAHVKQVSLVLYLCAGTTHLHFGTLMSWQIQSALGHFPASGTYRFVTLCIAPYETGLANLQFVHCVLSIVR